ncbi:hypothetical protein FACS189454_02740 [Planctomycetales bacterium]|nr:hypothetical protein FACS189454_02740 [Planctomycetales bacterium]
MSEEGNDARISCTRSRFIIGIARIFLKVTESLRKKIAELKQIHKVSKALKTPYEELSQQLLEELLGKDFKGILSSDFFSAYRKFQNTASIDVQFYWVHLMREILFADKLASNNLAEQVIRGVVIDRKITQGSHSDWGNAWMEFLQECVANSHARRTTPTLLK